MTPKTNSFPKEIVLSGSQLCYLGKLTGFSHILLPDDPYQGLLLEEIKNAANKAKAELLDIDLLKNIDQEMMISESLKKTIAVLADPELLFRVNISKPQNEDKTIYLYAANKTGVLLKQTDSQKYLVRTFGIHGPKILEESVFDLIQIKRQAVTSGEKLVLSMKVFESITQLSRKDKFQKRKSALGNLSLNQKNCEVIIDALSDPIASGSISLFNWKLHNKPNVSGVSFLENRNGLWELEIEENEDSKVIMTPISSEELIRKIKSVIKNALR